MKNLLILLLLFSYITCQTQTVRLFEVQDTVWYSLDKKAAQNLATRANKGLYFDNYVTQSNKLLVSVLEAKKKADSIQILLQQDVGNCYSVLINTRQDLYRSNKSVVKIVADNEKLKKQRLIYGSTAFGLLIILATTL